MSVSLTIEPDFMTEELIEKPTPVRPAPPRMALLIAILFLALGLRLAYVSQIDTAPFSDMADYENMALNLLEGKGLLMDTPHMTYRAYRPPLYPAFLAAVYKIAGPYPERVRFIQCLLSVLTVGLMVLLGREVFAHKPPPDSVDSQIATTGNGKAYLVGLVAAALLCLEETSIFFCGQLLSETLFTFLIVFWSFLLVRFSARPGLGISTLLGVLGGAIILLRPVFAPAVFFGIFWFFRKSIRAYSPPPKNWKDFSLLESPYAPPLVMAIYAAMIVSSWGFRNHAVLGSFVPVSTNSGVNFYLGHHEGFGYASFGNKEGIRQYLRRHAVEDETLESKFFTLKGLEYVRNNPWQDLRNNFKKVYYLYLAPATLRSAFLPWKWWDYLESPYRPWPWENNQRKLRFWTVRDEEGRKVLPSHRDWFFKEGRLPLVSWGWPMIYLSAAGLLLALRRRENVGLVVGTIFIYTITLVVFFTNARFRAPLIPFLYLFTAYAVVSFFLWLRKRTKDPDGECTVETAPRIVETAQTEIEPLSENGPPA